MSAFKRFFTGVIETGEEAKDERFRTRYYRGEQKKVVQEIAQLAKKSSDLRLVHMSESRGEVMLEYRSPLGFKHDLVVTVFAITPVQSAVDQHAALRARFVEFGFNAKLIDRIYKHLDQRFTVLDHTSHSAIQ